MMKNRIMWLLWLIGMAGATVVTGSWLMAAVLLLSALLLLLSAAVTSLGGRKTEIKLSVPRAAERNENFRGRMTLKNQSAWPVFGGRGEILGRIFLLVNMVRFRSPFLLAAGKNGQ